MSSFNKCIFYSNGHGSLDLHGNYVTAPAKMHKFKDGTILYEGVKNKEYGDMAMSKMMDLGINVVPVNHTFEDTRLSHRTNLANFYHSTIQKGIYLSEHSNAHNTRARGFSIWTSPGQTYSDVLATKFFEMYVEEFRKPVEHNKIKFRTQDYRDNDPDYEARFWELVQTNMPAVLFENLFFDNRQDAEILMDEGYRDRYTTLQAKFALWSVIQ